MASSPRILLTGGSGLLGAALCRLDPTLVAPPRAELDIRRRDQVEAALDAARPAIVLHAAALVGTRPCRVDPAACWETNVAGTFHVAAACAARAMRLVYISTDYVFDGREGGYGEDSSPGPLSTYGRSKLAGEWIVETLGEHLVIRTTFCARGPWKFPAAPVDQFTSMEPVDALAPDLLRAARSSLTGRIHIAGERKSLFELARRSDPGVRPIRRADVDVPLPADTSLDCSRWRRLAAGVIP